MERTEKLVKKDGRVPLIYDSAREKSEALLSITVDAPDALWVALESTTSTLIYPGPRANIRGEIDEGTSPTAARPWGSRVRSRALFFFLPTIDRSCWLRHCRSMPYLAARRRDGLRLDKDQRPHWLMARLRPS